MKESIPQDPWREIVFGKQDSISPKRREKSPMNSTSPKETERSCAGSCHFDQTAAGIADLH